MDLLPVVPYREMSAYDDLIFEVIFSIDEIVKMHVPVFMNPILAVIWR